MPQELLHDSWLVFGAEVACLEFGLWVREEDRERGGGWETEREEGGREGERGEEGLGKGVEAVAIFSHHD